MKALAPGFLIAMPSLRDPNFEKTVILMLEHNDSGSLGLVINRESDVTYGDVARSQDVDVADARADAKIRAGGPVERFRGFVLHDSPDVSEKTELAPGLFLSVSSDSLIPLLANTTSNLVFCLGYAGWAPGQIEGELSTGSWLFTEVSAKTVLFSDPTQMWQEAIHSMGVDPAMLVTFGGTN